VREIPLFLLIGLIPRDANDWRLCRYEMLSQPGETETCLPRGEIPPEMSGGKAGDKDPILAV
jgi:hypothetical protein